ncbi:hypothetical protein [Succinimonas amylolytica]|uniref:hypothetical protein n=1 Tax=Succinimonas amylolytica TaxID=83769 RepID=UPI0023A85344
MLGQIVRGPSSHGRDGVIYGFNGNIFYFTDADFQKLDFHIGDEVEFSANNTADPHQRRFFRTYVTVKRITESKKAVTADNVTVYREKTPRDIRILKTVKSYLAYGEAGTQEEALRLLVKTVKSIGGNAAVMMNLTIIISRISHKPFFIYSAVPVLACKSGDSARHTENENRRESLETKNSPSEFPKTPDETYDTLDPESFSFKIEKHMIRSFSPNHVFLWNAKITVLVSLLVTVPFIIQESYELHSMKWLAAAIAVLSLGSAVLFYLTPCFNVGYLRKQNTRSWKRHKE